MGVLINYVRVPMHTAYRLWNITGRSLKQFHIKAVHSRLQVRPFSEMLSLADKFVSAQKKLTALKEDPGNEAKLKLYALYKQATVGKVNVKRPGLTDFVGKAKWDAWNSLGDMSQDDAKQNYVDYVDGLAKQENVDTKSESVQSSQYPGFNVVIQEKLRTIQINQPNKKNAISVTMYEDFVKMLKEASEDPNTTIVAITGSGDYFSSGNDLTNMTSFTGSIEEAAKRGRDVLYKFVASLIDFPKPIVAVVNGPAVGIAVTILGLMDAVYAVEKSSFYTPFSVLGQSPEACSSLIFPRIMGPAKANQILLFNKKITANEACQYGLVTELHSEESLKSDVWPRLVQYSLLPSKSLFFGKQLIRQFDRDLLHKVNEAECNRLLERWQSEDCMQAIMNFFSRKSNL